MVPINDNIFRQLIKIRNNLYVTYILFHRRSEIIFSEICIIRFKKVKYLCFKYDKFFFYFLLLYKILLLLKIFFYFLINNNFYLFIYLFLEKINYFLINI